MDSLYLYRIYCVNVHYTPSDKIEYIPFNFEKDDVLSSSKSGQFYVSMLVANVIPINKTEFLLNAFPCSPFRLDNLGQDKLHGCILVTTSHGLINKSCMNLVENENHW